MNRDTSSTSGSLDPKLKPHVLNFVELLAQNIALISPTMTAALIVPLMYSSTGNESWLGYAVGTIMLLFVAYNLNQFARRGAGTGSMYRYVTGGLGLSGGSMCGWCLIWAYTFIGIAGTTGFTIFASKLLAMIHVNPPPQVLFVLCVAASFFISYMDIKITQVISLALEGFSVFLIILLALIVLGKTQILPDSTQFHFKEVTLSNLGLGIVTAIFSLVGFESSTAFGDEAVNPLKSIPRSVTWSLIFSGLFFTFITYVEVLGTHGLKDTLDKIDAPLSVMADRYGVGLLSPLLSAGAMFSFFALCMSCVNSGARVMFAMGRHGFLPASTSKAHPVHGTPYVSLVWMSVLVLGIVWAFSFKWSQMAVLDEFNNAGSMGAFGFLGAYFLITIAAPVFLKRRGEMKAKHVGISIAAIALMVIPAVGSVYPVPAAPGNYFPYVFLGYVFLGLMRTIFVGLSRMPDHSDAIHADMQKTYAQA